MSLIRHTYHIVFSTKDRVPLIDKELRPHLYEYIGGIIRKENGVLIEIGGMDDHVHILCHMHQSTASADMIRHIKSGSSRWINEDKKTRSRFSWQTKYGSFTVSRSNENSVRTYIQNQEEHHRNQNFQDEFRALLKKHDIAFDEKYVWD